MILLGDLISWFTPEALWIYVKVLIGVNALILVHEWGHFIVARACGVRCDKFYVWFDAWGFAFFRFKWGDTEYGLGWLPLGGYVKMLGQEDSPGRIKEELERAKLKSTEPADGEASEGDKDDDEKPLTPEELAALETALYAPDSYLSKNVPQRMAIISAGVIMNVIFAFLCATVAYMIGVQKETCKVGDVAAGEVAWQANLRPGDEVVEINDKKVKLFEDLQHAVHFGDIDNGVKFTVQRPGEDKPLSVTLIPEKDKLAPTVGVASSSTMVVRGTQPGMTASATTPKIKPGDKLIAIDGAEVTSYYQYVQTEAMQRSEPLRLTFERETKDEDARKDAEPTIEKIEVELPPQKMWDLGLILEIGRITAIQADSPAAEIGLAPGDILVTLNDEPIGDPMRLPSRMRRLAEEGAPATIGVKRGDETLAFEFQPRVVDWYTTPRFYKDSPVECAPLGVTYGVTNRIVDVVPDSPADKAGVHAGQRVLGLTFLPPSQELREKWDIKKDAWRDPITDKLENGNPWWWPFGKKKHPEWPVVFTELQLVTLPGAEVELMVVEEDADGRREVDTHKMTPVAVDDWFNPDRGLAFQPDVLPFQASGIGEAMYYGGDETWSALGMVVSFLKKIGTQVSARAMGGPVTIVTVAYDKAASGWSTYLLFLCLLSANLAVLNILPIPVLDGGHLVFLTYEGITGKAPSEKIQIGLSYVGLILLLSLMVFVLGLDLGIIPRQ